MGTKFLVSLVDQEGTVSGRFRLVSIVKKI